ncbi:MAG TPA: FAD binding domain-containing protein [Thermoanaerobaculia bacterium]|nr:FAD binding domain-containing protein [Thermoanaerobaculia bacterium]
MRDFLLVHVNGVPYRIGAPQAFETLSRFLRNDRRATGTKIVCEEGDCGACTVLVGRVEDRQSCLSGQAGSPVLHYRPINSCIQFLFQLDCTHIVTVEGLTNGGELTPVQDAMVRCHGAQCGYCTPGFIMAMAGLYECTSHPNAADVRAALTGNLCRCTGYEPIIRAALKATSQPKIEQLYPSAPIVRAIEEYEREAVRIGEFYKPTELRDAIAFKAEHPKCVIVQGATDFGVWCNKRGFVPDALLSLDAIEGLGDIRRADVPSAQGGGRDVRPPLIVGGRATLADFERAAREVVPELAPIMDRFGSPQIRNAGTLAGNIANASPIADTLPFLFVTNATLELTGLSGTRTVSIRDFYLGYKKLDLKTDEIITRIVIPLPSRSETLRLYKVSKRSHLDISSFTAAMLMQRTDGRVDSIRIAYGGVAPVVLRLPKTEEFLAGKSISRETFAAAGEIARGEVAPISDVRGSKEFRLQLAENVLQRFYYDCRGTP